MSLTGAQTITLRGANNRGFSAGAIEHTFNVQYINDPVAKVGETRESAGYVLDNSGMIRQIFEIVFYPFNNVHNGINQDYSSKYNLYDIIAKRYIRIVSCTFEHYEDEERYPRTHNQFPIDVTYTDISVSLDDDGKVQDITLTLEARKPRG